MATGEPYGYLSILLFTAQSPLPVVPDCQAAGKDFPTPLKRCSPRSRSEAPAEPTTRIIAALGLQQEAADSSAQPEN